jgi:PAS domain S-box-containing protein
MNARSPLPLFRRPAGEVPRPRKANKKKLRAAYGTVSPYLGALGVIGLLAMLLGTIYFTWLEVSWVPFLAGILVAAMLALVSRASRAEWIVGRRTLQLLSLREKLTKELLLRSRAEEALASVKTSVHYLDQEMTAMLSYVNAEQCFQYHNRAFRTFRGIKKENIDGRQMREVLGAANFAEIEDHARQALSGSIARFEGTQRAIGNTVFQLSTQFLPHFGDGGKVLGFFAVQTDITASKHLVAPQSSLAASRHGHNASNNVNPAETPDWNDPAARLRAALDNDEFFLYCQSIVATAPANKTLPFYEVLLRLKEEEQNLILPGSFLPFAEEHGMLPDLDRWVVRHLLKWANGTPGLHKAIYSVNISAGTITDLAFPGFVREQLRSHPLHGNHLCLEFSEADALAREPAVAKLIAELKPLGCLFAMSGIGPRLVPADLSARMPVDYLKISGDLVLNILREPVDLAKVTAINRAAHHMGIGTIAEYVENEPTLARLRELEVDLAQGFGISRPRPLYDLAQSAH